MVIIKAGDHWNEDGVAPHALLYSNTYIYSSAFKAVSSWLSTGQASVQGSNPKFIHFCIAHNIYPILLFNFLLINPSQ